MIKQEKKLCFLDAYNFEEEEEKEDRQMSQYNILVVFNVNIVTRLCSQGKQSGSPLGHVKESMIFSSYNLYFIINDIFFTWI